MSSLFYRNPRLTVLAIFLVVVSGLAALKVLPRTEDPEILGRNALVLTLFPGASADRVEALVTEKLEQELEEVEEISLLVSDSAAGVSTIQIELADAVTEPEEVWSRVRDRIADAEPFLPPGTRPPEFREFEISAHTLVVGLTWEAGASAAVLQRLGEELEDRLRSLPGTKGTELFGALEEEVLVEVDAARLAALGLSAGSVSDAVRASDAKVSAGSLRGDDSDVQIEVEGELDSLARVRRVPVARGADGRVLRLGEVARVTKGSVLPPDEVALLDGVRGVAVAARMESDYRVDLWSARARKVVAGFADEVPRGLSVVTLFDQSLYTSERLTGLVRNLALGAVLVVGVVLLALGWRSALLVGSSLPLATLMVLAGMRALGVPLHQMSVTGLIIALGLLIDNAIVVVDEVRHLRGEGHAVPYAISRAVSKLAVPLLGSTLTTVLAFLPLVLMPGPAGEFVGAMSISVILALVSSFALSLTVLPALAGYFDRVPEPGDERFWNRGFASARGLALYRSLLRFLFAHPPLALLLASIPPVVGFALGTTLEEQFFPPADRDQFPVELELRQGASIAETLETARGVRELLVRHGQVEAVHVFAGRSAPKFYYNMLEGRENAPNYAQGLVQLQSSEGARELMREVQDELDAAFPHARVLVKQLEQGPPFEAPVEIHITGPDLEELRRLGERARGELAGIPGVVHTRAKLTGGRPKLVLASKSEEMERAGLTNEALASALQRSLEGAVGGSLLEGTEELPVRVRVPDAQRADLDRIQSLELASPRGEGWVPIDSLGELELVPEAGSIPHRDGLRTNTVQGFLVAGLLPAKVLGPFTERLDPERFPLPPGYEISIGGEAEQRDDAVANLASSAAVLVVLMAATLVLSFNSFRIAAIVGLVALLSVGLALGALGTFGFPFGFMAIVGSMGLLGVAINDTIVVFAAIREDEHARAGEPDAVREIVVRSTRHVVATTLTTAAGFLPLIVSGGRFWQPLAVAIAGGVGGATLLALIFAPSAYLVLTGRERRARRGARARAREGRSPALGSSS